MKSPSKISRIAAGLAAALALGSCAISVSVRELHHGAPCRPRAEAETAAQNSARKGARHEPVRIGSKTRRRMLSSAAHATHTALRSPGCAPKAKTSRRSPAP